MDDDELQELATVVDNDLRMGARPKNRQLILDALRKVNAVKTTRPGALKRCGEAYKEVCAERTKLIAEVAERKAENERWRTFSLTWRDDS